MEDFKPDEIPIIDSGSGRGLVKACHQVLLAKEKPSRTIEAGVISIRVERDHHGILRVMRFQVTSTLGSDPLKGDGSFKAASNLTVLSSMASAAGSA